jgi:hypothetical protein
MSLPKVEPGAPAGKWGEPDGQDGNWITVDEAIGLIRQHCPGMSHEEAEALLKAAVTKGLVQTRLHETAYSFLRHTDYYQPDIEKLFEEAATEEPAIPPVVEPPAASAKPRRGPTPGARRAAPGGLALPQAGARLARHRRIPV